MRSLSIRRFIYIALISGVIGLRWVSLDSVLPPGWTPEKEVRFTARILEQPQHTDSKTIIRKGIWIITIKGYTVIKPGETYVFVGKVTPRVLLGNATRIEMMDPSIEKLERPNGLPLRAGEWLYARLASWRNNMVQVLQKSLPEPHAALSAGILLGIRSEMPYDFYQQLINTGTLHVVAASGYNVAIVARVIMVPLLILLPRGWVTVAGVAAIVIYAAVAGSSPAVVRAGIMGSLTVLVYIWGRAAEARRLLWITATLMLIINPLMLVDIGFQLSVAATAGLLYLEPTVSGFVSKVYKKIIKSGDKNSIYQAYLANYLYPTLAATIATLPIIVWNFGRISWISPLVNMLILPVVPLIMGLTTLVLALGWIPVIGQVAAWLLYVPLWYSV